VSALRPFDRTRGGLRPAGVVYETLGHGFTRWLLRKYADGGQHWCLVDYVPASDAAHVCLGCFRTALFWDRRATAEWGVDAFRCYECAQLQLVEGIPGAPE
jgi:hypothetical protein